MARTYLTLFLAGVLLMLPGIGLHDLVTSHEGRVAQTARQMAASGWPWNATPVQVAAVRWQSIDGQPRLAVDPEAPKLSVNPWLVPVMSGNIRLQKPPLPYWATAVCFKLFGVNPFAARLVPTLLAALLVVIVADLARRLMGPRAAVWAGLVWLSTWFCVEQFRKSMPDPYLAFFAITAVWAWARGNDERKPGFLLLFYVCLGLGFVAKGPAVFVGALTGVVSLAVSQRRMARTLWPHVVGLLLLVAIALPWYVAVKVRVPNAMDLWRYEAVGGFGEKQEKPQPVWTYLPMVLTMALPWTPLWIAGIIAAFKQRRRALVAWQGLIVAIFTVITQKKMAYLMPSLAAQTLLVVQGILWWLDSVQPTEKQARWTQRLAVGAAAAAVVIAAVMVFEDRKDNARSARPVARAAEQRLAASGASLETAMVSPEVAFYLPLDTAHAGTGPVRWTILNVGRYGDAAARREIENYFGRVGIESVRQVPLEGAAGKSTWGLFEVRLKTP